MSDENHIPEDENFIAFCEDQNGTLQNDFCDQNKEKFKEWAKREYLSLFEDWFEEEEDILQHDFIEDNQDEFTAWCHKIYNYFREAEDK